jgi:CHAT domain-containing protein/tetratricopeptide (TPR) repeat protein
MDSWTCYREEGRRLGAFPDAARLLEARLSIDPRLHIARAVLGAIESDLRRPQAEKNLRDAADGLAAEHDVRSEGFARRVLAAHLQFQTRLVEARRELERALELADASGDQLDQIRVRISLGFQANYEGDYGRASLEFRRALLDLGPEGPARWRTWALAGVATVWDRLGRQDRAAEVYRQEAELHAGSGNRFAEAVARANACIMDSQHHGLSTEERLRRALQALETARAAGSRGSEAIALGCVARESPPAEALARFREQLAIARELKDIRRTVSASLNVAEALLEINPPDREGAMRVAQEAVELGRRTDRILSYTPAVATVARIRWRTGPRDQAIRESLEALELIEQIRERQPEEQVRARTFSRHLGEYYYLSWRLIEPPGSEPDPGDLELSFQTMERMRARQLLDRLDTSGFRRAPRMSPEMERSRSALLEEIGREQRVLLDPSADASSRDAALAELERLEIEETALRDEVARSDPEVARLHRPRVPSIEDLGQALADDEALIVFHTPDVARYRIGCWALSHNRGRSRVYSLPGEADLRRKVEFFTGLLDGGEASEAVAAARLHDDLLGDILLDLPPGVRHLTIVPDGVLHLLPFAALRARQDADPLGARYALSIAPSATAWYRWKRSAGSAAPAGAIVLADPEVGGALPPGVVASGERGGILATLPVLGPLPYARKEARQISSRFGDTKILAGSEASESSVKGSDLARYPVFHVAAHALVDEETPDRSGIVLAPGAPQEDGLLQFREITALDLRDKAVVLSACRSAAGEVVHGEGMLGLAHAFFQAGARTVVGTLWPLRDDAAARFFDHFYRQLARGRSMDEALAESQRAMIRSGTPPRDWAGVVVMGDGRLALSPAEARSSTGLIVRLIVVSLLVATLLVISRRRNASPD